MAKNHKSTAKKAASKPAAKSAAKKARPAPPRAPAVKAAPNGKTANHGKPNGKPATHNGKTAHNGKPAKSSPPMEKPSKKTALRDSILKRKAASKPIAFSLDEVRAIAKTVTSKTVSPFPKPGTKAPAKPAAGLEKVKPQHVKAASLADIEKLQVNVRQALTLAVDREALVETIWKNATTVIHSPIDVPRSLRGRRTP